MRLLATISHASPAAGAALTLSLTLAFALGLGLGVAAGPAHAAAVAARPGLAVDRDAGIWRVDLVKQCWRRPDGGVRCRMVYVSPNRIWNPDRYPVGSTAWWRAMDRKNAGGFRN